MSRKMAHVEDSGKYLEDWEIPLPPQDKQGDIIRKIQSLSSFVAQSQMVSTAWRPQLPDSVEKNY